MAEGTAPGRGGSDGGAGDRVPGAEASVPITDHGLAYGLGFFETFRTSGGRVHGWERHQRRLESACHRAGIELPGTFFARSEARRNEAVRAILAAQGLGDAAFRYTVTAGRPGPEGRYLAPEEILTWRPLPPAAAREGIDLRQLQLARDNGEWLPRPKSLNYANALLGANELARRAARVDDEGLFVSREQGFSVETTRQNLAWLERGRWFYPDPAIGAVAGTCLEWALSLLAGAEPRCLRPAELAGAEAVVVLNAVRGVTPVARLWNPTDERLLGEWRSHLVPGVAALREAWSEALRATARG